MFASTVVTVTEILEKDKFCIIPWIYLSYEFLKNLLQIFIIFSHYLFIYKNFATRGIINLKYNYTTHTHIYIYIFKKISFLLIL